MTTVRKELSATLASTSTAGTPSATFCISAPSLDRDNERVFLSRDERWDSFQSWKNAGAPWCASHDSGKCGIGTSLDSAGKLHVWKADDRWYATCFFDASDEESMKVHRALRSRRMGAASVAFVPHDSRRLPSGEVEHRKNELTEISVVVVPAHREATVVEVKRLRREPKWSVVDPSGRVIAKYGHPLAARYVGEAAAELSKTQAALEGSTMPGFRTGNPPPEEECGANCSCPGCYGSKCPCDWGGGRKCYCRRKSMNSTSGPAGGFAVGPDNEGMDTPTDRIMECYGEEDDNAADPGHGVQPLRSMLERYRRPPANLPTNADDENLEAVEEVLEGYRHPKGGSNMRRKQSVAGHTGPQISPSARNVVALCSHCKAEAEFLDQAIDQEEDEEMKQVLGRYRDEMVAPRREWLGRYLGDRMNDFDLDAEIEKYEADYDSPGDNVRPGEAGLVDDGMTPYPKSRRTKGRPRQVSPAVAAKFHQLVTTCRRVGLQV
jgi:hypothetical protein